MVWLFTIECKQDQNEQRTYEDFYDRIVYHFPFGYCTQAGEKCKIMFSIMALHIATKKGNVQILISSFNMMIKQKSIEAIIF